MPVVQPHSYTEMLERQRQDAERDARKYHTMILHMEKTLKDDTLASEEIVENLLEYIELRKKS